MLNVDLSLGRKGRIRGPIKVVLGINCDNLLAILLGKKAPFGVGQRMAQSDKGLRAHHVVSLCTPRGGSVLSTLKISPDLSTLRTSPFPFLTSFIKTGMKSDQVWLSG